MARKRGGATVRASDARLAEFAKMAMNGIYRDALK